LALALEAGDRIRICPDDIYSGCTMLRIMLATFYIVNHNCTELKAQRKEHFDSRLSSITSPLLIQHLPQCINSRINEAKRLGYCSALKGHALNRVKSILVWNCKSPYCLCMPQTLSVITQSQDESSISLSSRPDVYCHLITLPLA